MGSALPNFNAREVLRSMRRNIIFLSVIIATCLVSSALFAEEAKKEVTFVAEVNQEGKQVVEITGGEYYFEPNHIVLKVGVPTVFIVKRTGYMVPHNIKIDQPDAGMSFDVDMSKSGNTIEFTPTKAGTYPFICDKKLLFFESHKEKGMDGVIEVVE